MNSNPNARNSNASVQLSMSALAPHKHARRDPRGGHAGRHPAANATRGINFLSPIVSSFGFARSPLTLPSTGAVGADGSHAPSGMPMASISGGAIAEPSARRTPVPVPAPASVPAPIDVTDRQPVAEPAVPPTVAQPGAAPSSEVPAPVARVSGSGADDTGAQGIAFHRGHRAGSLEAVKPVLLTSPPSAAGAPPSTGGSVMSSLSNMFSRSHRAPSARALDGKLPRPGSAAAAAMEAALAENRAADAAARRAPHATDAGIASPELVAVQIGLTDTSEAGDGSFANPLPPSAAMPLPTLTEGVPVAEVYDANKVAAQAPQSASPTTARQALGMSFATDASAASGVSPPLITGASLISDDTPLTSTSEENGSSSAASDAATGVATAQFSPLSAPPVLPPSTNTHLSAEQAAAANMAPSATDAAGSGTTDVVPLPAAIAAVGVATVRVPAAVPTGPTAIAPAAVQRPQSASALPSATEEARAATQASGSRRSSMMAGAAQEGPLSAGGLLPPRPPSCWTAGCLTPA
ncbi:hypothetical protein EON62_00295, partial [archaeon]